MISKMEEKAQYIDLLDYWRVILKRKKLIAAIVAVSIVASVGVSLLLPKKFVATASILPSAQEDAAGMTSALAGLGALTGGLLGGSGSSQTGIWMGILRSNALLDGVIEKMKLKEAFNKKTLAETRETLKTRLEIAKSKEDIISISVEDTDPVRSADLANAIIEELDIINQNITMTSGKRTRVFVEKRLVEAKNDLSKIEDEVRLFQERKKAIKLDDQSKAIIETVGTLKGQLMAKEMELETLLTYATQSNPQVQLLKSQINELKAKLKEMAEGVKGVDDVFIPIEKMPHVGLQYARLLREAKVQETVYQLLTQQYEMARIQEAKDGPTIQVLDIAKVPEVRTKPNRKKIVMFSTFLGFAFSIVCAFFLEYVEKGKLV